MTHASALCSMNFRTALTIALLASSLLTGCQTSISEGPIDYPREERPRQVARAGDRPRVSTARPRAEVEVVRRPAPSPLRHDAPDQPLYRR